MPLNMCCPVVVRGAFSPNVQIEISTNNQDEINIDQHGIRQYMKIYKRNQKKYEIEI